jgi:hypothetical protein
MVLNRRRFGGESRGQGRTYCERSRVGNLQPQLFFIATSILGIVPTLLDQCSTHLIAVVHRRELIRSSIVHPKHCAFLLPPRLRLDQPGCMVCRMLLDCDCTIDLIYAVPMADIS